MQRCSVWMVLLSNPVLAGSPSSPLQPAEAPWHFAGTNECKARSLLSIGVVRPHARMDKLHGTIQERLERLEKEPGTWIIDLYLRLCADTLGQGALCVARLGQVDDRRAKTLVP